MRVASTTLTAVLTTMLCACAGAQHAGQRAEDRALTTRVEARLAADPDASMIDVDVDTIDGIVTLRGDVPGQTELVSAEEVARHTTGVRAVRNLLVVRDDGVGEVMSDAWIRTKVGSRLTADPDVRRFRIDVDVSDGAVTLSGTVASEEAREAAENVARRTTGVKRVVNELRIAEQPAPARMVE